MMFELVEKTHYLGLWLVYKVQLRIKIYVLKINSYLLLCLLVFVLFFGVNEIDLSLLSDWAQSPGSFTLMILCGVGGEGISLLVMLPTSALFNSFWRFSQLLRLRGTFPEALLVTLPAATG